VNYNWFKNREAREEAFAKIYERRTRSQRFADSAKKWAKKNKEKVAVQNFTRDSVRRGIVEFKKERCERCNTDKKLEVHHKKYTKNPDDWICLCSNCHVELHKKLNLEIEVKRGKVYDSR